MRVFGTHSSLFFDSDVDYFSSVLGGVLLPRGFDRCCDDNLVVKVYVFGGKGQRAGLGDFGWGRSGCSPTLRVFSAVGVW